MKESFHFKLHSVEMFMQTMIRSSFILLILLSCSLTLTNSLISTRTKVQPRVKPVHENFFLDFAGDPAEATPRELYGEVAYKSFVAKNNPDGLLVAQYDILTRIRQTKVLSALAESGLLQALEAKGLTLSRIEKLLPLVDELNLLPLALKNKDLVISLAPLLIEPAPLLLPIVSKIVTTPASNFLLPGFGLSSFGVFETVEGNLIGIVAILLGLPAVVVGSALNLLNFESLAASAPSANSVISKTPAPSINRPTTTKQSSAAVASVSSSKQPVQFVSSTPKVTSVRVAPATATKKRKVVKIN